MSDNQAIQRILIRSAETREQSPGKAFVAYKIEVYSPMKVWSIWKRYSDFDDLHQKLRKRWPTTPVPASLPPKSAPSLTNLFGGSTSSSSPDLVESRRIGLEQYLNTILKHSDERWRGAPELLDFLAVSAHLTSFAVSSRKGSSADITTRKLASGTPRGRWTAETWLVELEDVRNLVQELRTLLSYRDQLITDKEPHEEQSMQCKKLLASISMRLNAIGDALNGKTVVNDLTDGELIRRKDLITNLKHEKERLSKEVHRINLPEAGEGGTVKQEQSSWRTASGQRVFGRAVETEETKKLDNQGILHYQKRTMEDQDSQLDQMMRVVQRQKEMGLAIGDELDLQNEMLNELDQRADLTRAKLKGAQTQMKRLK